MAWIIFSIIIIGLLIYDLGFAHQDNEVINFKQTIYASLFYIIIACIFGLFIFVYMGIDRSAEYFTCYFIEKAMSLDNIFVISMIFQFFSVPLKYQHRILFFGVLGVIIFRGIMIYFGMILIAKFEWLLYIFAIILIITGIKTFYISKESFDIKESYIYKILWKYCNLTDEIEGDKYFIRKNGKINFTPLFASLVIIETMDLIFALDSIPAIFAITNDSFVIYTSNIFAILGLRSLFFCLANIIERFSYIKYSLALILILIGVKIFASHFINIPTYLSLVANIVILFSGIFVSLMKKMN
ncbi:MAG: TerC/Alx family metal homeostasis membrane protein [Candidatus Rickettsia vulgarisii]